MARIAGVDLPKTKRVIIGLTYIYGIGRSAAEKICSEANVDVNTRVNDLTEEEVKRIRTIIQNEYKVEGALKTEVNMNIKRLMDINSVRGYRHHRGLPVHGQRTKTNARTRKGRKRLVGGKKK
ncbi:MAG: 30S ribosomal protein S13 [Calditrichaceae bacterium]|nr:30S ribosomal protein S13 [Calditrichaceae bacterium]HES60090.1 30S ribosomal protein S13 [Caldithrix sp.]